MSTMTIEEKLNQLHAEALDAEEKLNAWKNDQLALTASQLEELKQFFNTARVVLIEHGVWPDWTMPKSEGA